MSSPQEQTLATYNMHADTYRENTIDAVIWVLKYRIDETLKDLPKDTKILEVGTATGRDADYMESLWYHVTRSDAADSFISYQKEQGKQIISYNALTDTLHTNYDLIFANAVLLHFTPTQCKDVLQHRKEHLNPGGKISRCVQQWQWESMKDNKWMERYFYYWSLDEAKKLMEELKFSSVRAWVDEPTPNRFRIRCIATL